MNRDELVEHLHNEIASRDERIGELENVASYYASRNEELREEVAATKAQDVVMPERWNVPRPMWKDARQPYGNPLNHADIEAAEKFNLALDEVARLNAAPAADAGIVDMYRHLQKVTPYRFKKIQDASITDGGDVMYFHKDRFDAALLADMAAHCAAKGVV